MRNISNGLNSKSETAEERVNELKNKPREREEKNEDSRTWETCGKVLRVQKKLMSQIKNRECSRKVFEEIIAETSLVWWKTKIYISNICQKNDK